MYPIYLYICIEANMCIIIYGHELNMHIIF
jgi:hypothetical protein